MAHGGRARGEMGDQRAVWQLNYLTTGLGGEAWGGGPWRAGKGGDGGGHQRAVWGATKVFPVLGSQQLSDLAGDEGGGWGGGVGRWPMEGGQGGRGWGGGHQRAVWEQQKMHWFLFLGSLKNRTTGTKAWGGMGPPESS